MDKVNNFQINQNVLNSFYEFDSMYVKESNLRANVSLKKATATATALLSLSSISQVHANSFNFNVPKNPIEATVLLANQINDYTRSTNILIDANFNSVDKYKIIEDVLSFKSLENSWDGFNAIPLGIKCATNAIKLIENLDNRSLVKITDYFPNPNGTISFEWENLFREIISLEIGKETFSYYVSLNNVETKYFNKQSFDSKNIEILRKFISSI